MLQRVPHHGLSQWLLIQIFYDHVNYHSKRSIDQAAGGKLRNKNASESWKVIEELASNSNEEWEEDPDAESACEIVTLPSKTTSITEESLGELERKIAYLLERRKNSLGPQRATVNAVSAIRAVPLSESPLREKAETFRTQHPQPPPSNLSPEFESRMRQYMATHSERLARFEEMVDKRKNVTF